MDRDVVDQRKTVIAHTTSENSAITPKKTNANAAETSKQYTSRYNMVNGGPNKELYKGPNEELLL